MGPLQMDFPTKKIEDIPADYVSLPKRIAHGISQLPSSMNCWMNYSPGNFSHIPPKGKRIEKVSIIFKNNSRGSQK